VVERSVLQHLVYSDLREHCISKGCDLVVYDLQLGIKDEFAFGHILRDLSRKIMKQVSTQERRALLTVMVANILHPATPVSGHLKCQCPFHNCLHLGTSKPPYVVVRRTPEHYLSSTRTNVIPH
jgi:hypothetical protein